MIDTFKVKAEVNSNKLLMQLRGYFMKSELELAFYLARKEVEKLSVGFEVVLDLDGMHTDKNIGNTVNDKAYRIFKALGAGKVRNIGVLNYMSNIKAGNFDYFSFESVGIYPN
jgi:hypothetical protein